MKRIASVIGIKDENIDRYEELHAAVWPEILDRLSKSNVHNYSIFRFENTLFAYMEYLGEDFEADMAAIAADPKTQEWWTLCVPLQSPMPGRKDGEWWMEIKEVFHLD
ncbi:MAG TPA: L-rhamnose mutarotase [Candidatus Nanopelagicaceae bacterium]